MKQEKISDRIKQNLHQILNIFHLVLFQKSLHIVVTENKAFTLLFLK